MCDAPAYTIHAARAHYGWSRDEPPVLTAAPGDTCRLHCRDAFDGQFGPGSTAADIEALDPARANPVTGPVRIDGAEPGDMLAIRIEAFRPSGLGFTAILPGFGLLADQFPDPALQVWRYDPSGRQPLLWGDAARLPLRPFAGTIGLAPAEPGRHSVIPPRRVGGNMDIRDLTAGTTLYLPVEVPGALLSIGDTHAAQGDGEVCGTAIESAMEIDVTVDLIKDRRLANPRFTTAGPVEDWLARDGYEVTTGIGPDLMAGARDATAAMIDHLGAMHGLPPSDAYMLCSVCASLRISEIVDAPNWVVSLYFPRAALA